MQSPVFVESSLLLRALAPRRTAEPRQTFQNAAAFSQPKFKDLNDFGARSGYGYIPAGSKWSYLISDVPFLDLHIPTGNCPMFPSPRSWRVTSHAHGLQEHSYNPLDLGTLPWNRTQFRRRQRLHIVDK